MEKERSSIDRLLAPNASDRQRLRDGLNKFGYYLLIVIITLVATVLIPFIAGGIYGDFSLYFPSTTEGWVVYWIIRATTAALNLALFALFKMQAKTNVKDDPMFVKAKTILNQVDRKYRRVPRSPMRMEVEEWTKKGITIVISTVLAGATISSLILSFDIMTFISAVTGALIGLGFGYVTMRKNEIYWTEEYLEYAEMIKEEEQQASVIKTEEKGEKECCNLETESSETCKSK